MSHDDTEAQAALDAGMLLAEPQKIGDGRALMWTLPEGAAFHYEDLERFGAAPVRPRGTAQFDTLDSLMGYANTHAADATGVYVGTDRIEIVLNDDTASPGWRDYRAVLPYTLTPEWRHWTSHDGELMAQMSFAEHVQDGLREVLEPDAATMLEIVETFTTHTQAQYSGGGRVQSGAVNLRFTEDITASAGQSHDIEVPSELLLAIQPYRGSDAFQLTARFRYRIRNGTIHMGYKLDRPHAILEQAQEDMLAKLREAFGQNVYLGTPPASLATGR